MKNLTTFTIILLLSLTAKGQYLITNFTGTAIYGTRSVTVTSAGSVLTYADPCLGPPTLYWAGQIGPGSYSYSFNRPVYSINVDCDYLNSGTFGAGEYLSMNVNGSFYALTAANMTSYSVCGSGGGPSYLYTGFLMGPNTAGFAYNGGSFTISMCTGISSFEIYCNGIEAGVTWHVGFDTLFPCIHAIANSPCVGDTLKLDMVGDSTGATYLWTGPGGFTSVLQDPFIFPCVMTDSGLYTCIRTLGLVSDTDSVRVVIHPKPVLIVSNNSPLCMGLVDTLNLSVVPDSAGETFFLDRTGRFYFGPGISYPNQFYQSRYRPIYGNRNHQVWLQGYRIHLCYSHSTAAPTYNYRYELLPGNPICAIQRGSYRLLALVAFSNRGSKHFNSTGGEYFCSRTL